MERVLRCRQAEINRAAMICRHGRLIKPQ